MAILALDVGTTESGYALVDDNLIPVQFGKIENEALLQIVKNTPYDVLVYEEFQSYGMAIGQSTIRSITWNGRFIQSALDRSIPINPIFRKDVKMNFCGNTKAKDTNIRQALIDRFAKHDFKNGKGVKNNPDWFYGFKADCWSAYALAITYYDLNINPRVYVKF